MTKKRKLPSPRVLRRLLDYCPETGELRWRERPVWLFPKNRRAVMAKTWNKRLAGKPALTNLSHYGYGMGSLLGFKVSSHRVAFAIYHGKWPEGQIDHINGYRSDNRICNLRSVTPRQNMMNRKLSSNNTSGVMGVVWNKENKNWVAKIKVNGKGHHIGSYATFEDAIAARKAAEKKYGFHPNHGRE